MAEAMIFPCRDEGCDRGFRSMFMRRTHERTIHGLKFSRGGWGSSTRPAPLLGPETPERLKHGKCWSTVDGGNGYRPFYPDLYSVHCRLPEETPISKMLITDLAFYAEDTSERPWGMERAARRSRAGREAGAMLRQGRRRLRFAAEFLLCA